MKKTILALIIFAVIFTTAYSLPWEVQIEGHPVVFEVEPRIIQGQLYVPLYTFYQQLGLSISFDHTRMTVTGGKSGLKIETKIGSDTALINGNPRSLEGVPVIIANRTMVPLNFVAKTFGYNVIVSSDLKVFYLRKFITPYKDIADANMVEAGFNALEGLPPVSLSLKEMEGRKEHYLNAGASWKEIIFISEKKDVALDEAKYEPSRFYTNKKLYGYFILVNTSEYDIETPFNLEIKVKGKTVGTQKVDQLKKGEKFEVSGFEISGLTLGNNIIEVFVDPEGVLNKKDTQDYFYRIIYAYSTR